MIICHCAVVSDRSVTQAVAAGARSLGEVCRTTGAGRDCGACVFSVKQVITEVRHSSLCPGSTRINGGEGRRGDLIATSA